MRSKRLAVLLLAAFLLSIVLACDISFSGNNDISEEEIRLELTRQSLQITQTAAAAPPADTSSSDDGTDADQAGDNDAGSTGSDADDSGSSGDTDEDDGEDTCNISKFVSETIPDGTVFLAGETFTKKWVVRNNGTCDWTTGYRFVFEQGTQLGGPTSMALTHTVEPGETYTFEMDLAAPAADGEYIGRWRIKSNDGENLGFYYVQINVGVAAPPPAAFAVTGVLLSLSEASPIDIVCPGNKVVTISAAIKTSAAGLVSFKWDDSQGCVGCATKSTTFAGAETKTIAHTMTVGAAGDYWAKIYIDAPNHQWFGPKTFTVVCNP
jgi:hypothetical protein